MHTIQRRRDSTHEESAAKTRFKRQEQKQKARRITSNVGLHYKTSFSKPSAGRQQWDKLKRLHDNNMLLYSTQGRQYIEYKSKTMKKRPSTSSDEAPFEVQDCLGKCFVRSTSKFRKVWDLLLSALILYSCIIIPYRVGFDVDTSSIGWTIESIVIDVTFAIDLFLNFFTFETDKWGHRSVTFRSNALRYLRTWFLVDFFSTVPFDRLLGVIAGIDKDAVRTIKLVRVVRLTRLLKLVRLLKLKKSTVQLFAQSHTLQHAIWRIVKLLFFVLFLAHLLTCFWHYTALMSQDDEETWLTTLTSKSSYNGIIITYEGMTVGELYASAFYWVIATMMAVGYGDVHAINSYERVYSILTMILGAAFFGVMVANISSLLETINARSNAFRRKMEVVKAYMKDRKLPKRLQARIRGYYMYYFGQKSLFNEEDVLNSLSTSLRNELVAHTNSRVIHRVNFFRRKDPSLTTALLTRMKPMFRITDEVLGIEGDIAKEMFFLVHGVVEMLSMVPSANSVAPILPGLVPLGALAASRKGTVEEAVNATDIPLGSTTVGVLTDGDQFGDPELLLQCRRPCGFRAASVCDLQTLSKQDLEFVMYDFPQVREDMVKDARHRLSMLEAVKASQFITTTLVQLDPRTAPMLEEMLKEGGPSSKPPSKAPSFASVATGKRSKVQPAQEKYVEEPTKSGSTPLRSGSAPLESQSNTPSFADGVPPQGSTPGKKAHWSLLRKKLPHSEKLQDQMRPSDVLANITQQIGKAKGQLTFFDAAACVLAASEVALSLKGWDLARRYVAAAQASDLLPGANDFALDDEEMSRSDPALDLPHLRSPLLADAFMETKALEAASTAPMSPTLLRGALENAHKSATQSLSNRRLRSRANSAASESSNHKRSRSDSRQPATHESDKEGSPTAADPAEVSKVITELFEECGVRPLVDEWTIPLGKRAIELGITARKVFAERKQAAAGREKAGYSIADALGTVRSTEYRTKLLLGPLVVQSNRLVFSKAVPPGLLNRNAEEGEQVVRTVRRVDSGGAIEGVETESSIRKRGVLHPQDKKLMRWDLFMALAIVLSVLEVPFTLAFVPDGSLSITLFEAVIDLVFLVDLILRFRVAYLDRERDVWETRPSHIAKHYLKHEFTLDFLSTFPFDRVADAVLSASPEAFRSLKLIRTIRLVRLLKLFRMARFRKYLSSASDNSLSVSPALVQLFSLTFQVTLVAHFLGCFFFVITTGIDGTKEMVWWLEAGVPDSVVQQYIASLYWGFTTMTTVGYGDLTPTTTEERLFAVVAMLIGATVFGYIVGSISSIVMKLNASAVKYDEKMEEISEYLRDIRVPNALRDRVMTYYEYFLQRRSAFDEDTILADLSDSIRREVILYLNKDIIQKIPYFMHEDREFVSHIVSLLKPQFYHPGNYLYREGEVALDMFFLVKGKVEIVVDAETQSETLYAVLESGSYFGELSLLLGIRRSSTARAVTPCNVFVLNKEDIQTTVGTFPALAARMEQSLRESLMKANNMKRHSQHGEDGLQAVEAPADVAKQFVSLWQRPEMSTSGFLNKTKNRKATAQATPKADAAQRGSAAGESKDTERRNGVGQEQVVSMDSLHEEGFSLPGQAETSTTQQKPTNASAASVSSKASAPLVVDHHRSALDSERLSAREQDAKQPQRRSLEEGLPPVLAMPAAAPHAEDSTEESVAELTETDPTSLIAAQLPLGDALLLSFAAPAGWDNDGDDDASAASFLARLHRLFHRVRRTVSSYDVATRGSAASPPSAATARDGDELARKVSAFLTSTLPPPPSPHGAHVIASVWNSLKVLQGIVSEASRTQAAAPSHRPLTPLQDVKAIAIGNGNRAAMHEWCVAIALQHAEGNAALQQHLNNAHAQFSRHVIALLLLQRSTPVQGAIAEDAGPDPASMSDLPPCPSPTTADAQLWLRAVVAHISSLTAAVDMLGAVTRAYQHWAARMRAWRSAVRASAQRHSKADKQGNSDGHSSAGSAGQAEDEGFLDGFPSSTASFGASSLNVLRATQSMKHLERLMSRENIKTMGGKVARQVPGSPVTPPKPDAAPGYSSPARSQGLSDLEGEMKEVAEGTEEEEQEEEEGGADDKEAQGEADAQAGEGGQEEPPEKDLSRFLQALGGDGANEQFRLLSPMLVKTAQEAEKLKKAPAAHTPVAVAADAAVAVSRGMYASAAGSAEQLFLELKQAKDAARLVMIAFLASLSNQVNSAVHQLQVLSALPTREEINLNTKQELRAAGPRLQAQDG